MKINEPSALNTTKPQSNQLYETPRAEGSSSDAAGSSVDAGDNIDLGSQSSLLSLAQAAGASQSSATVLRLQALIQSGQYQIDPAALSNSIINSSLDGD